MSTFPGKLAHSRGLEPARLSGAGVTDVGGDPVPRSVNTDLDLARTASGGDRPMAGALATESFR